MFYLDTLDIKQDVIYGAFKQLDAVGNVKQDNRGRHNNRKQVSLEARDIIENHIKSFPTVPSHYCRKTSQKNYLSGELNISLMYRLYKEQCQKNNVEPEKKEIYSNVFHCCNLAFQMPKKDRCDFCESFENLPNAEEEQIKAYEDHIRRKDVARHQWKDTTKQLAKEQPSEISAACFDLQQVLNCPHGQASDFFYKRKLGVYNLSVYDLATSEAYCYMWPQHLSKRGSNEIGLCVLSFIKTKVDEGKTIVYLTADNCGGQNKNKFIATMLWHAINSIDTLQKVELGFLEKGHTQNENDAVHGVITNSVKKVTLFSPEQWYNAVRMARIRPRPLIVKEMALGEFSDFKAFSKALPNFKVADDGTTVNWTTLRHISISKADPNALLIKQEHDGVAVRVDLMRRKRRSKTTSDLPQLTALSTPCGVPKPVKDDLVALCAANLIPQHYHEYFSNLPVTGLQDNTEPESESSDRE